MHKTWIFLLLLLSALAFSACAGAGGAERDSAPEEETAAEAIAGPETPVETPPEEEPSNIGPATEPEQPMPAETGEAAAEQAPAEQAAGRPEPAPPTQPVAAETAPAEPGGPVAAGPEPPGSATEQADSLLHIYGEGVAAERWYSLSQLQQMGGTIEAEYYYRGKDPDRGHSACRGIGLAYLLDQTGLAENARQVKITASDGYGASYTLAAVRKAYLDETDSGKKLYMILAWFKDGQETDSLTLVMGQNVAEEYNRMFWVRDVIEIEVQL